MNNQMDVHTANELYSLKSLQCMQCRGFMRQCVQHSLLRLDYKTGTITRIKVWTLYRMFDLIIMNGFDIRRSAMVHAINGKKPAVGCNVFIAWNAEVAGRVTLGDNVSVWFGAVLRGDVDDIVIGEGTNIQDGTVMHADEGIPCKVGKYVTVGHRAILHGCTVEDGCLIGMGAIILDKAVIGAESVVGAGALVTQGKVFPPRSLIIGSPARAVRTITDADIELMKKGALHYIENGKQAQQWETVNNDSE